MFANCGISVLNISKHFFFFFPFAVPETCPPCLKKRILIGNANRFVLWRTVRGQKLRDEVLLFSFSVAIRYYKWVAKSNNSLAISHLLHGKVFACLVTLGTIFRFGQGFVKAAGGHQSSPAFPRPFSSPPPPPFFCVLTHLLPLEKDQDGRSLAPAYTHSPR